MTPDPHSRTLTLFDSDALTLLAALALVLLLAGIAAGLSLRAKTRIGAIAGLWTALLLMAFLPLWTSLLWLFLPFGAPRVAGSAYLWLVFATTIHLEWLFGIGTLVAALVYIVVPGMHRARLLRTLACLAGVIVIAIGFVVIQLHRNQLLS